MFMRNPIGVMSMLLVLTPMLQAEDLLWQTRTRTSAGELEQKAVRWDPARTAVIVCDMWDDHHCKGAARRVAEMAPRMNRMIHVLRDRGALIIHAPSNTLDFYKNTPQLARANAAPKVETKIALQRWCHLMPDKEGALPIDDSNGGCACTPKCPQPKGAPWPWTRQIATIDIEEPDAISDSATAFYLMKQRGITNVLVMGVHINMCVLGRPFSIRQMVTQGQQVILVRDMTDSMYDPRQKPFVDHFSGTQLVVEHIEKHWCPTVTSDQILGGKPFRFQEDPRDSK